MLFVVLGQGTRQTNVRGTVALLTITFIYFYAMTDYPCLTYLESYPKNCFLRCCKPSQVCMCTQSMLNDRLAAAMHEDKAKLY